MPEVKAANASEVATHKYPYWKTMADDCDQHPVSAYINQEHKVSSGYTGLFHQMGRCQTTPRPDSHKNHSRTGQAVLHIRHPRNRPLRPGLELRKQHCPECIGCLWDTKKPHNTLSPTRRWNGREIQLYVEKQEDWEQHLSLALYAYRTATHRSIGVSHSN